jgi:hypothetical protein
MHEDITARCTAIEACYEYMLAYAGKGLGGDEGSQSSSQVRDYLTRAATALSGLSAAYATAIEQQKLQSAESYRPFLAVLDSDHPQLSVDR